MSPNVLFAEKSWTNGIQPTFEPSNSFTGLKMPNHSAASCIDDFTPLRIEIRRWEKPSRPYTWEIWASETKCVERSSYEYPTRGSAAKAARRALLRITLRTAHSPGGGVFDRK
jgi:hypothetical protein